MVRHAFAVLSLFKDRRAVTALEYGLIASVLFATILVGFIVMANKLSKPVRERRRIAVRRRRPRGGAAGAGSRDRAPPFHRAFGTGEGSSHVGSGK